MMTKKKIGRPLSGKAPSRAALVKQYVKEGLSVRAIAEASGCSKDMIHRALKQYEIPARSNAGANVKRSKLWNISLQVIENEVEAKGLRGAALTFGVDHSALFNHLKARQVEGK